MITISHYKKFLIGIGVIIALALGISVSFFANDLKAAVSAFYENSCYTAAATSTQSYMTAGLATTTVTCNFGSEGVRTATVLVVVNSSSTVTQYDFRLEESYDGQDW